MSAGGYPRRDFSVMNGVVQEILAVQERLVSRQVVADEIRARTVIADSVINASGSSEGISGMTGASGASGASGMTGTPGETGATGPPGTEVNIPGTVADDIATFTGTGTIQDSKGGSLTSAGVLSLAATGAQIRFGSNPVFQIEPTVGDTMAVGRGAGLVPGNALSTAVGYLSLAAATAGNNTAVGYQTLASSTSGVRNTAIGTSAGTSLASGQDNVFIGFEAGKTSDASGNTFIGSGAGPTAGPPASGGSNTAIGASAAFGLFNGTQNTVVGMNAGLNIGNGSNNVVIGMNSGGISPGIVNNNVIIGAGTGSLFSDPIGSQNVILGASAAAFQATGSNNVLVGYNTQTAAGNANCILLGSGAKSLASGQIGLGGGGLAIQPGTGGTINGFLQVVVNGAGPPMFIPLYSAVTP